MILYIATINCWFNNIFIKHLFLKTIRIIGPAIRLIGVRIIGVLLYSKSLNRTNTEFLEQ